jgi:hypothetical protein
MNIEEPVNVELSDDGAPVRFLWRGVVYGVTSAPERWFARRSWWQLDGRAPRGTGAALIEQEMWRVDALPLTPGAPRRDGTFDLGLHAATGGWRLSRASDDVLDAQLFA